MQKILLFLSLFAIQISTSGQEIPGWTCLGPSYVPTYIITGKEEGAGRIDCIALHPNDSAIMYAGSPSGGLWKTSDYGNTWIPLTDTLPSIGISDVQISHSNPDTLYIATGDRYTFLTPSCGIFKSYNGGLSWQETSFSWEPTDSASIINRVLINPVNPASILVATNEGIYKSIDNLQSAHLVGSGYFFDMEYHPTDTSIVYASTFNANGNASIFKSDNGGISFSEAISGISSPSAISRIEIEVTPAEPEFVAAFCVNTGNETFHGLYTSINKADDWTLSSGGSPNILGWSCDGGSTGFGNTMMAAAISPTNASEIITGSSFIWKSGDKGLSWNAVSGWCGDPIPYVRPYHRAVKYGINNSLFMSSDGGLFRSDDAGTSWLNISGNMEIMPVFGLAVANQPEYTIYAGTKSNGRIRLKEEVWHFLADGDGRDCVIDPTNDDLFYSQQVSALSNDVKLSLSADGGHTYRNIKPENASEGSQYPPLVLHPSINTIIFCGYDEVYKSMDMGTSWEPVSDFDAGDLHFLAISSLNEQVLYAGTTNRIWRSGDAGSNWVELSAHLPDPGSYGFHISSLAVSSSDPNKIWLSSASYADSLKILYSSDGGLNWADYSQGLPNLPVNTLVYQDESNKLIYAGTDLGVFYRSGNDPQWKRYGANLPNVTVTDLEINYAAGRLVAGTYGRGIWEIVLFEDESATYAEFVVEDLTVCGGSSVQISDNSQGEISSWKWNFGDGAEPQNVTGEGPHIVTYSTSGEKTISLIINDSIVETKINLISSVSSIDITVFPKEACSDTTIEISVSGAQSYTWSPEYGLSSTTGSRVQASPATISNYVVEGTLGACTDKDTVKITIVSDEIGNAIHLQKGINGPFGNVCATANEFDPSVPSGSEGNGCNTQDGWCKRRTLTNTTWFSFDAPESGLVSIDAFGNFDNQIAVISAESAEELLNGNYTVLAANDNYHGEEGNNSGAITGLGNLLPGKKYWVFIDGGGTGDYGEFHLTLSDSPLVLSDRQNYSEFDLYPNPSSDKLILIIHKPINALKGSAIIVYDFSGKRILSSPATEGVNSINIHHLQDGIYFVSLISDEYNWTRKFIKTSR